MLILTRSPGETICIGDDIKFSVLDVRGNQVRLGIAAPRNVSVDREEIRNRKMGKPEAPKDDEQPNPTQRPLRDKT